MTELDTLRDEGAEAMRFARRTLTVFLIVLALFGVLLARYVQLQVHQAPIYATRSEANRILVEPIAPPRGLIYDRAGRLLAGNAPVFSLALVRERVENLDHTLARLRELVGVSDAEIEAFRDRLGQRRRPLEPVTLRVRLTAEEQARLAVERPHLPGVEVRARAVRHYPYGELFAHALGSVRRISEEDQARLDRVRYSATEFVGKTGVEQYYEDALHGTVGYRRVETDARGRIRRVLDEVPPEPGHRLTLHLDAELQQAAWDALGDRRGAIVAIDPATGGLLALVSKPAYDPNLFVNGLSAGVYRSLVRSPDKPLFNRALAGQYAPGSTFKPIVGLAGLQAGAADWDTTILDRGAYRLPGQDRVYRDWTWRKGGGGGHGEVDLRKAIYRSTNVYFYDLAHRMGVEPLAAFARRFGLGQDTDVDLPGAASGLMPDPEWKRRVRGEIWYPGDSVNLGIGQGNLLVTPLQLAAMTATIARRGERRPPRVLFATDGPIAELPEQARVLPPVQLTDRRDWERMIDAMEAVVHRAEGYGENGTAWYYIGRDIHYRMAGKSGTAQVVEIPQGQEYDAEELDEYHRKHAWFIAFAPADDPQIAVSVLVENGGGGSAVAAPVARSVIDAWLLADDPEAGTSVAVTGRPADDRAGDRQGAGRGSGTSDD